MNKLEILTKALEKVGTLARSVDHTGLDDGVSEILYEIGNISFNASCVIELIDQLDN